MTPEQKERARRLIDPLRIVAEHEGRFYAGPKGCFLDSPGNRSMAANARADATALRAVLALVDADEAGAAYCDCGHHLMPCGCCVRDGCRCERENAP